MSGQIQFPWVFSPEIHTFLFEKLSGNPTLPSAQCTYIGYSLHCHQILVHSPTSVDKCTNKLVIYSTTLDLHLSAEKWSAIAMKVLAVEHLYTVCG